MGILGQGKSKSPLPLFSIIDRLSGNQIKEHKRDNNNNNNNNKRFISLKLWKTFVNDKVDEVNVPRMHK